MNRIGFRRFRCGRGLWRMIVSGLGVLLRGTLVCGEPPFSGVCVISFSSARGASVVMTGAGCGVSCGCCGLNGTALGFKGFRPGRGRLFSIVSGASTLGLQFSQCCTSKRGVPPACDPTCNFKQELPTLSSMRNGPSHV